MFYRPLVNLWRYDLSFGLYYTKLQRKFPQLNFLFNADLAKEGIAKGRGHHTNFEVIILKRI